MNNKIKNFKYHTSFSSTITRVHNADLDKYISLAGLEKLKPLMPANVNLDKNMDLIGIVANAAVAGRMNANGDSITNETAVAIAQNFINKYVDASHNREKVIGMICNYGFSKFGDSSILSNDDIQTFTDPFNISLALLLWKPVLSDEFIDLLEKTADPTSDQVNSLSLSWELFFNDYDIAVGSKNISEAKIVTDQKEKDKLESFLLSTGGKGKDKQDYIYRVIKPEFLIPAGVGIVGNPAADVKGLEIIENEPLDNKDDTESAKHKNEASISLSDKKDVIETDLQDKLPKTQDMKITKLEDITPDFLKSAEASATIIEFVQSKLHEANEKWKTEQGLKEKADTDKKTTETELATVQANLKTIQDQINKKQAEEVFAQRMTYFDETYELEADDRKIIGEDVKGLDDAAFTKLQDKYGILLKAKKKGLKDGGVKDKNKKAGKDNLEDGLDEDAKAKKAKSDKMGKDGYQEDKDGEADDDDADDKPAKKKKSVKAEDSNDQDEADLAADQKTEKDGTVENKIAEHQKKAEKNAANASVLDEAIDKGEKVNADLPNAQGAPKNLRDKMAEAFSIENTIELIKY